MTSAQVKERSIVLIKEAIERGDGIIDAKCFFMESSDQEANLDQECVDELCAFGVIRQPSEDCAEITYIALLNCDPPILTKEFVEQVYLNLMKQGFQKEGLIETCFFETSEADLGKIEAEKAAMEFALQMSFVKQSEYGIYSLTGKGIREVDGNFPTTFVIVQPTMVD